MYEHEKLELGKMHGHHKKREGKEKFEEFEEETHAHNVYKHDKHHLKLRTGI